MEDEEWSTHFIKTLGVLLNGEMSDVQDRHGQPVVDDTFLLLLNASPKWIHFTLPKEPFATWQPIYDTREETGVPKRKRIYKAGQRYRLMDRSLVLLKRET